MRNFFKATSQVAIFVGMFIAHGNTLAAKHTVRNEKATVSMDEYLRQRFQSSQPGAVVLVVKEGKTLLNRAYGLANIELQVPMRTNMVFDIASVSKQFTAAAILRLVEQGSVDLQAPVTKYLPQAPISWNQITIHNLLTHTSGLGNLYDDADFRARVREDYTPDQLLEVAASKQLVFNPGTQFQYASINYSLLGLVVERQSGTRFDAYLQEQFFAPLGMRNTTGLTHGGLVTGMVTAYGQGPSPVPYFSPSLGFAAGSYHSTAADLALWNTALHSGQVISNTSLRAMTTAHRLPDGTDTHYGYGIRPHTMDGLSYLQSNGDIPGFHSETVYLSAKGVYVVVLYNGEEVPLEPIAKRLVQFALGQSPKVLKPIQLPPEGIQAVLGKYALNGHQRIIRLENGIMVSDVPGGPPSRLSALSRDEFYFDEDPDSRLHFEIANGKAIAVTRYNVDRAPMAKFPRVDR